MAYDLSLTATIGNKQELFREISKIASDKRISLGGVNSRAFTQPLGRIRGELGEFEKSLEASNARVIAFGMSAGAIFAVTSALKETVRAAIDVEKKLADISVVMGRSNSGIAEFGNSLFDIASKMGQSFNTAADAALSFARQGLNLQTTLKRTSDALLLTRMSGLSAEDSVSAITAAMNSFNSAAIDSTRLVNQMAAVDMKFAVSSADLAEGIRRVGSTASDAGVSIEQLIALITSAQQTTQRGGAVIGNALKSIFTRLERPKVLEQLESIGIQFKNLDGSSRPVISVLQELAGKYDQLSDAQQSHVTEMVGGIYQMNVLKAILRDTGKDFSFYSSALKTASEATDEAQQRSDELNTTLSSKLVKTLNNLTRVGATIGNLTFAPAIDKMLNTINDATGGTMGNKLGASVMAGFGKMLSGPGLAFGTLIFAQLSKRMATFLGNALSQISGIMKGRANTADIEAQLTNWLKREKDLMTQIANGSLNINDAQTRFIEYLRTETLLLQGVKTVSKEIAVSMNMMGFKGGNQGMPLGIVHGRTKAAGHIPDIVEKAGAIAGGYKPGRIKQMVLEGKNIIYNDAEDVVPVRKVMPWATTNSSFIIPPQGSNARNTYDKRLKAKGINPETFKSSGFVPNLSDQSLSGVLTTKKAGFERIRRLSLTPEDFAKKPDIRYFAAEHESQVLNFSRKRYAVHGLTPEKQAFFGSFVRAQYEGMINALTARLFDVKKFAPFSVGKGSTSFGPIKGYAFEDSMRTALNAPASRGSKDILAGTKTENESSVLAAFGGTSLLKSGIIGAEGAELKLSSRATNKSIRGEQALAGPFEELLNKKNAGLLSGPNKLNQKSLKIARELYQSNPEIFRSMGGNQIKKTIRERMIQMKTSSPLGKAGGLIPNLASDNIIQQVMNAAKNLPNSANIMAKLQEASGLSDESFLKGASILGVPLKQNVNSPKTNNARESWIAKVNALVKRGEHARSIPLSSNESTNIAFLQGLFKKKLDSVADIKTGKIGDVLAEFREGGLEGRNNPYALPHKDFKEYVSKFSGSARRRGGRKLEFGLMAIDLGIDEIVSPSGLSDRKEAGLGKHFQQRLNRYKTRGHFAEGFVPNLSPMISKSKLRGLLSSTDFANITYQSKPQKGELAGRIADYRVQSGGPEGVRRDLIKGSKPPRPFKTWKEFFEKRGLINLYSQENGMPAESTNFRSFSIDRIKQVRTGGKVYDVKAGGKIPNLAISLPKLIKNNLPATMSTDNGSSLDFVVGRKDIGINWIESKKKGEGREMFSTLANIAKERKLPIVTDSLNPQYQNFDRMSWAKDNSEALHLMFPQMRYREGIPGLNTEGSLFLGGQKQKFHSLDELKSLVKGVSIPALRTAKIKNIKSYFAAMGLVPNLQEAVGREMDAGYSNSQVKIGYDRRIGPLVYNTTEGNASQAVDLHVKQGKSISQIKRLGSKAGGHIPNLAEDDGSAWGSMGLGIGMAVSQAVMMRQGGGYKSKDLELLKGQEIELGKQLESLKKSGGASKKSAQLLGQITNIQQQYKAVEEQRVRFEKIQNRAMATSFISPFVGGIMENITKDMSPKLGKGLGILGDAVGLAATAMFAIPGPIGVAIGGIIGSLNFVSRGFHVLSDEGPKLQKKLDEAKNNFGHASDSIGNFAQIFDKLSSAYQDQKTSSETIAQLHRQYIVALADVPEQYRGMVASAASAQNAQDAVGKALMGEANKVNQLNLATTLTKKVDASSGFFMDTSVFDNKTEEGKKEISSLAARAISSADKPEEFAKRVAGAKINSGGDFIKLIKSAQQAGEIGDDLAESLTNLGKRAGGLTGWADKGAENLNDFATSMQNTAKETTNAIRSMEAIKKVRELQARFDTKLKQQSEDAAKSIEALSDSIRLLAARGLLFANARATLSNTAKTNLGSNQISITENAISQLGAGLSEGIKGRINDAFSVAKISLEGGSKFRQSNTEAINSMFNNVKDALNDVNKASMIMTNGAQQSPADEQKSLTALKALNNVRGKLENGSPEEAFSSITDFIRDNDDILGGKLIDIKTKNEQIITELTTTRATLDQDFREQLRVAVEGNKINAQARRVAEAQKVLGGAQGFMDPTPYKESINDLMKGLGALTSKGTESSQGYGAFNFIKGVQGTLGFNMKGGGANALREMAIQARGKEIYRDRQAIIHQTEASAFSAPANSLNRYGLMGAAGEMRQQGTMKKAMDDARIQIEGAVPLDQMPKDVAKQVILLTKILGQLQGDSAKGFEEGAQAANEIQNFRPSDVNQNILARSLMIGNLEEQQKDNRSGMNISAEVAQLINSETMGSNNEEFVRVIQGFFEKGDLVNALKTISTYSTNSGSKNRANDLLKDVNKFGVRKLEEIMMGNSRWSEKTAEAIRAMWSISLSGNSHSVHDHHAVEAINNLPKEIAELLNETSNNKKNPSEAEKTGAVNVEKGTVSSLSGKILQIGVTLLALGGAAAIIGTTKGRARTMTAFGGGKDFVKSKFGRGEFEGFGARYDKELNLINSTSKITKKPLRERLGIITPADVRKSYLEEYANRKKALSSSKDEMTKNLIDFVHSGGATKKSSLTWKQYNIQAKFLDSRKQFQQEQSAMADFAKNGHLPKPIGRIRGGLGKVGGIITGLGAGLPFFMMSDVASTKGTKNAGSFKGLGYDAASIGLGALGMGVGGGVGAAVKAGISGTGMGGALKGGFKTGLKGGIIPTLLYAMYDKTKALNTATQQSEIESQYSNEMSRGDYGANNNRPTLTTNDKIKRSLVGGASAEKNTLISQHQTLSEAISAKKLFKQSNTFDALGSLGEAGSGLMNKYGRSEQAKKALPLVGELLSTYNAGKSRIEDDESGNPFIRSTYKAMRMLNGSDKREDADIKKSRKVLEEKIREVLGGSDMNPSFNLNEVGAKQLQQNLTNEQLSNKNLASGVSSLKKDAKTSGKKQDFFDLTAQYYGVDSKTLKSYKTDMGDLPQQGALIRLAQKKAKNGGLEEQEKVLFDILQKRYVGGDFTGNNEKTSKNWADMVFDYKKQFSTKGGAYIPSAGEQPLGIQYQNGFASKSKGPPKSREDLLMEAHQKVAFAGGLVYENNDEQSRRLRSLSPHQQNMYINGGKTDKERQMDALHYAPQQTKQSAYDAIKAANDRLNNPSNNPAINPPPTGNPTRVSEESGANVDNLEQGVKNLIPEIANQFGQKVADVLSANMTVRTNGETSKVAITWPTLNVSIGGQLSMDGKPLTADNDLVQTIKNQIFYALKRQDLMVPLKQGAGHPA